MGFALMEHVMSWAIYRSDCSEQLTPDKVRIRTIRLDRFPAMNIDGSWDPQDPPIYISAIWWETSNSPATPHIRKFGCIYELLLFHRRHRYEKCDEEHTLQLRDFDPTEMMMKSWRSKVYSLPRNEWIFLQQWPWTMEELLLLQWIGIFLQQGWSLICFNR